MSHMNAASGFNSSLGTTTPPRVTLLGPTWRQEPGLSTPEASFSMPVLLLEGCVGRMSSFPSAACGSQPPGLYRCCCCSRIRRCFSCCRDFNAASIDELQPALWLSTRLLTLALLLLLWLLALLLGQAAGIVNPTSLVVRLPPHIWVGPSMLANDASGGAAIAAAAACGPATTAAAAAAGGGAGALFISAVALEPVGVSAAAAPVSAVSMQRLVGMYRSVGLAVSNGELTSTSMLLQLLFQTFKTCDTAVWLPLLRRAVSWSEVSAADGIRWACGRGMSACDSSSQVSLRDVMAVKASALCCSAARQKSSVQADQSAHTTVHWRLQACVLCMLEAHKHTAVRVQV